MFVHWGGHRQTKNIALSARVPKQYKFWPPSAYIGTTLRPEYILFRYMDPVGSGRMQGPE